MQAVGRYGFIGGRGRSSMPSLPKAIGGTVGLRVWLRIQAGRMTCLTT